MIRLYTDRAIAAKLKRQRLALAAQFADAIGALAPDDCPHQNRPSCPRCAQRRTVEAAAEVVRVTGGAQ